ncbi:hypothetical protein CEXT_365891 [Caerostris extrusa]|uniref:Uncharacterized protein n=1 Tax=Caerostris extrusa TaxID=172846 RepID=A0AAV4YC94_CAEEX|nr:hypothetical protein CEXT_365891 [Caerostris extrusa]
MQLPRIVSWTVTTEFKLSALRDSLGGLKELGVQLLNPAANIINRLAQSITACQTNLRKSAEEVNYIGVCDQRYETTALEENGFLKGTLAALAAFEGV